MSPGISCGSSPPKKFTRFGILLHFISPCLSHSVFPCLLSRVAFYLFPDLICLSIWAALFSFFSFFPPFGKRRILPYLIYRVFAKSRKFYNKIIKLYLCVGESIPSPTFLVCRFWIRVYFFLEPLVFLWGFISPF